MPSAHQTLRSLQQRAYLLYASEEVSHDFAGKDWVTFQHLLLQTFVAHQKFFLVYIDSSFHCISNSVVFRDLCIVNRLALHELLESPQSLHITVLTTCLLLTLDKHVAFYLYLYSSFDLLIDFKLLFFSLGLLLD